MDFKEKMQEKLKKISDHFDANNRILEEKRELREQFEKEVTAILEEQRRLQGEYKAVGELIAEYEKDNKTED